MSERRCKVGACQATLWWDDKTEDFRYVCHAGHANREADYRAGAPSCDSELAAIRRQLTDPDCGWITEEQQRTLLRMVDELTVALRIDATMWNNKCDNLVASIRQVESERDDLRAKLAELHACCVGFDEISAADSAAFASMAESIQWQRRAEAAEARVRELNGGGGRACTTDGCERPRFEDYDDCALHLVQFLEARLVELTGETSYGEGGGRGMARKLPEHPADRLLWIEGEVYARKHAKEFCEKHSAKLRKLVSLYADAEAEALLSELREAFWAQAWKPARKKDR